MLGTRVILQQCIAAASLLLIVFAPRFTGVAGAAAPWRTPAKPAISAFDGAHVPWLQPTTAVPPYMGLHNDVNKLLVLQKSPEGEVSLVVFSSGVLQWALNCIYSLLKYGQNAHVIVAATDAAALAACLAHRLPCLNATHALAHPPAQQQPGGTELQGSTASGTVEPSQPSRYRSQYWKDLTWAKVVVAHDLLSAGGGAAPDVLHLSDVDVVYLRPVWPAYRELLRRSGADAVFMEEKPINTGVFALRRSARTLRLMAAWLAARVDASNQTDDQTALASVIQAKKECTMCVTKAECQASASDGMPAVHAHAKQFGRFTCPPRYKGNQSFWSSLCDFQGLFVHAVCSTWLGSAGDADGKHRGKKADVLAALKLQLLDGAGLPLYNEDEGGQRAHPFLSCKGPAWGT